ncbi:hypothetical protein V497_00467 [Pseudogymnoascus sp. VKM F-4516 (FW-969)]|nr:hypothetical protein V497_00467 [Pseudogymnoascus sp. VKM F-4516 (FW-969)]
MPTIHEVPEPNNENFSTPKIPGEYPTNSPRFTSEDWILSTPRTKTLIELDKIPTRHNVLAVLFSWLLLGGYMVLPGTFPSLHNLETTINCWGNILLHWSHWDLLLVVDTEEKPRLVIESHNNAKSSPFSRWAA